MKIYKYFRGHDKKQSALDNTGIIWLTDDVEYAEMYSNENENGCVSVVYVDCNKLNYIDFEDDDYDEFDEIDPDMSIIEKYKDMGYNCYDFTTNGNSMILALLDTVPIVKVEPLETTQQISEVKSNDINLSSFKIKKELHPKFWPNGKLNSRVRLRLMDIADDFVDELSVDWVKPKDIILTGSIANYNWSRYSDVDIHILIDFKKVYPKNSDFVDDYFKAKKENWLRNHEDLKIFGFPIEISVEDSNEDNPSSGRYSLYKNKWVVDPDDFQDAIINQNFVKKRSAEFMTQIDSIEKELDKETDLHKCEKCGDKVYKIFDKLKNMRTEGLASSKKEMSSGNIIYKIMRRAGYIDKIWEIYNASYDKVNSIDDKRKEINEAQRRGERFSAGIIPFRMNKNGKTEVFLGFPGRPKKKGFKPPMWMDRWQILKGHMENGEDPLECAIREFCEESGVSPRNINSKQLINLGTEKMTDARKLICYGLDITDNTKFDKTEFHSNLIDRPSYIEMNGGKAYPEIEKYEWKEVGNVGASAPYETAFYNKCDEICQSRYSKPSQNGKTVILSDEQNNILKETFIYEAMKSGFNGEILRKLVERYSQRFDKFYSNVNNKDFMEWMSPYDYCVKYLGEPIGNGSSRDVFQIDDTRVLKLAKNQMGIKQNHQEWSYYTNTQDKELMPIIFNDSDTDSFTFLIQEYALPIDIEEYFENDDMGDDNFADMTGYVFDGYQDFIKDLSYANSKAEIEQVVADFKQYYLSYSTDKEMTLKLMNALLKLKYEGHDMIDYTRDKNWGIVNRNGKATPVIVDMGWNNDLISSYRNR